VFVDDLSFDPQYPVPAFAGREPGAGQRWTTWPSTAPTERGPRPHPSWLVTSAGAFDTELGIVKTGKEADLFLIERADPSDASSTCVLAAKRYRGAENSDFHRSASYREGRGMRNTRDSRAVARGSAYGKTVGASHWAHAEFDALCQLFTLQLPVPYPVQISGTEILMEFIGDGITAAPRLAQARVGSNILAGYLDQTVEILRGLAAAGFAHGDLSPYNLLVHRDRIIVIDLPQLVDLASNPTGLDFLHRDCVNVCSWFIRHGVDADPEAIFGDLVARMY
jgi:RIO kinase 1